ncbi:A24 family peptidase [Streptomyces sp. NPDC051014]|uniref:prepilin peptidase n=1 Tax=Streptomyces sp. NPDC051014 TaxID=3155751 RepID=UPI003408DDC9
MTGQDLVLVAAAAVWGAASGTLLPRAAYRFSAPAGEPWRTACPADHPLGGWLGRARCAACATADAAPDAPLAPAPDAPRAPAPDAPCAPAPDAPRAPAQAGAPEPAAEDDTEPEPGDPRPPASGPRTAPLAVATALVCAALAGATGTRPELVVWLLLAPVGVLLAAVDFRVQRLPDPLTLPFAAAALALLGGAALLPEHAGDWLTALYASLALGAGYFVLFLVNPGGMGFGDVKLALGTGAVLGWYGWPTVLLGTFAGFLLGALYGGALVVVRRAGRKTAIAFGPFLIAGAFAALLVGAYTA